MSESLRFCRRCSLLAASGEDFRRQLTQYLSALAPEDTADQALYEERLALCAACPECFEGMCRLCGCYVEFRAALRLRGCPAAYKKW